MALLQLLQKALLLLNVVLLLLLNMTGNGIAAATKKGITSAKDGAVTVLNYIHTRSLQPSVLPCQNSVSIHSLFFVCPRSLLKEEKIISSVQPHSIYVEDVCHPLSR